MNGEINVLIRREKLYRANCTKITWFFCYPSLKKKYDKIYTCHGALGAFGGIVPIEYYTLNL